MASRFHYYRRILRGYLRPGQSQLSFWWERPGLHPEAFGDKVGPYYMHFRDKADYDGPFDDQGVPQLDYHGAIGLQYNPIAIAQYGLARYNRYLSEGNEADLAAFLAQADWLHENLRENEHGVPVWMHDFDWDYRETLVAPWYSGLAQGQGISCLVRAHLETGEARYERAAHEAFRSMRLETTEGGVLHTDDAGDLWIEEYLVNPPSHILNGFIWGLWGVRDYAKAYRSREAQAIFDRCVSTLKKNLPRFDTGAWSLYEIAPFRLRMLASPFYHGLHITQMEIMHRLTGDESFKEMHARWSAYANDPGKRRRALIGKALFKAVHY